MKYIDLEKIFRESNYTFLKKLPVFVRKIFEKILMQDELNRVLTIQENKFGVDFINGTMQDFNITADVTGLENLPENKRCFFVANHPFGIIDGLVLTKIVSDKFGPFKSIANDSFMYIPHMHPVVAAVNSYGKSPKEYIVELEKVYASDFPITHFPAGEVSRPYKKIVEDTVWQKSMITKAVQHKRDIVPFYFHQTNSKLFLNIFRIRKFFRIKTNIELILLPKEMFQKRNGTIKVTIGKPISWKKFDKSKSQFEWAQKLRAHVYKLKESELVEF
ncbi:MAG: 1-acyl-sn-glycerol-3-phosphate acyltransferase [Bacteroidales bacterium]|nr:1-acyl-sn-glycerol-3-phosphate acyltransferase [Bacteroidales bacterium]MBN2756749.1 1-acyl-sn-glycerol-3-phosphate acyltransferase [Bacteroidales bacterium]